MGTQHKQVNLPLQRGLSKGSIETLELGQAPVLEAGVGQVPADDEGDLLLRQLLLGDEEGVPVAQVVVGVEVQRRVLRNLHRPDADHPGLLVLREEGRRDPVGVAHAEGGLLDDARHGVLVLLLLVVVVLVVLEVHLVLLLLLFRGAAAVHVRQPVLDLRVAPGPLAVVVVRVAPCVGHLLLKLLPKPSGIGVLLINLKPINKQSQFRAIIVHLLMERINVLVSDCLSLKPKLNSLADLLELLCSSAKPKDKTLCARHLVKIFTQYQKQCLFASKVGDFLKGKLSSFVQLLTMLSPQDPIYVECIDKVISLANSEDVITASKGVEGFWGMVVNAETATYLIKSVMKQTHEEKLRCLLELPPTMVFETLDDSKIEGKESTTEERKSLEIKFKKEYQALLFSVLKDPALKPTDKRIIIRSLGERIFSKIESPLSVSEYIINLFRSTEDLDVKVDLLSALFLLVGRHGLEVDDFYGELYSLITTRGKNGESVFEISNSKRVFKMLQNSLRSSKVPSSTIVKFVRSLLEECMLSNSEFVCWTLALVFNLFKKHTSLSSCLNPQSDVFISQLRMLQRHYLPQIKSLSSALNKNLRKDDFLDISEFTSLSLDKVLKHQLDSLPISQLNVPHHLDDLLQM